VGTHKVWPLNGLVISEGFTNDWAPGRMAEMVRVAPKASRIRWRY